MRKLLLFPVFLLCSKTTFAQQIIKDNAVIHQQDRMVFLEWNQSHFEPNADKFLGIPTNPYWWAVWGLFDTDYHNHDIRPLSPTGPQTQRLALVGVMQQTDNSYKLQSDTIRNTALLEITNQTGLLSDADPLWQLYYKNEFQLLLNDDLPSILSGLTPAVSAEVTKEGIVTWYKNELDMLKERLNGLRTTTVDRGARIMGYYRMLNEYYNLNGIWTARISAAQMTLNMAKTVQTVKTRNVTINNWTSESDVTIAKKVLSSH